MTQFHGIRAIIEDITASPAIRRAEKERLMTKAVEAAARAVSDAPMHVDKTASPAAVAELDGYYSLLSRATGTTIRRPSVAAALLRHLGLPEFANRGAKLTTRRHHAAHPDATFLTDLEHALHQYDSCVFNGRVAEFLAKGAQEKVMQGTACSTGGSTVSKAQSETSVDDSCSPSLDGIARQLACMEDYMANVLEDKIEIILTKVFLKYCPAPVAIDGAAEGLGGHINQAPVFLRSPAHLGNSREENTIALTPRSLAGTETMNATAVEAAELAKVPPIPQYFCVSEGRQSECGDDFDTTFDTATNLTHGKIPAAGEQPQQNQEQAAGSNSNSGTSDSVLEVTPLPVGLETAGCVDTNSNSIVEQAAGSNSSSNAGDVMTKPGTSSTTDTLGTAGDVMTKLGTCSTTENLGTAGDLMTKLGTCSTTENLGTAGDVMTKLGTHSTTADLGTAGDVMTKLGTHSTTADLGTAGDVSTKLGTSLTTGEDDLPGIVKKHIDGERAVTKEVEATSASSDYAGLTKENVAVLDELRRVGLHVANPAGYEAIRRQLIANSK